MNEPEQKVGELWRTHSEPWRALAIFGELWRFLGNLSEPERTLANLGEP